MGITPVLLRACSPAVVAGLFTGGGYGRCDRPRDGLRVRTLRIDTVMDINLCKINTNMDVVSDAEKSADFINITI